MARREHDADADGGGWRAQLDGVTRNKLAGLPDSAARRILDRLRAGDSSSGSNTSTRSRSSSSSSSSTNPTPRAPHPPPRRVRIRNRSGSPSAGSDSSSPPPARSRSAAASAHTPPPTPPHRNAPRQLYHGLVVVALRWLLSIVPLTLALHWAVAPGLPTHGYPPLYTPHTVFNTTLSYIEDRAALALGERGPFTAHKLGTSTAIVLGDLRLITQETYALWPVDSRNASVRSTRDRLHRAHDSMLQARKTISGFERSLSAALWASSDRYNLTLLEMRATRDRDLAFFVPPAGPVRVLDRVLDTLGLREPPPPPPPPELVRATQVWTLACGLQRRLLALADELLAGITTVGAALHLVVNDYNPAYNFLRQECHDRHNSAVVLRDAVVADHTAAMAEWTRYWSNNWRVSEHSALRLLGMLSGGLLPPERDQHAVVVHETTLAAMEELEARLIGIMAHMDILWMQLDRIQRDMAGPVNQTEERAGQWRVNCSTNALVEPAVSPFDYVHFVDGLWHQFRRSMVTWKREDFTSSMNFHKGDTRAKEAWDAAWERVNETLRNWND